ncbi:type VI secretion system Vgr family protein [Paraliomyxa miuraensis]|uniref:type VI secretion system Vgr family protein n=1 Tax=Paraliomyxa miuraensis TaxID=376150 RepID=UPI002251AE6B|nr:type VI secretion system tip protein TssI/VgrG [Paraliomyxa miuraensis]MCX4246559.1 type VI secretion system tip protein VgrG [Paraliomyxa miuraensis]
MAAAISARGEVLMSDGEMQPVRINLWPSVDTAEWLVSGMVFSERFNEPYMIRLQLVTHDLTAEPAVLLGTSVTITVERGAQCRDLCGIVYSVEDGSIDHDDMITTIVVVPALLALGQRKTSRIFQDMTVPQILQEVLDEGLSPYERTADQSFLSGEYPPQEYTVQYRETDLAFVERLMEENGIGYYFEHEGEAEILELFDSDAAYSPLQSFGNNEGVLPMVTRDGSPAMHENIYDFSRGSKLQPTVARTMVFDWLAPGSLQKAENAEVAGLTSPNGGALAPEREIYEHEEPTTLYGYRSEGLDFAAVERQTLLRRQLHQRDAVRCRGTSTATLLTPATKVELVDHPQEDLDGQYLVVSVEHRAGSLGQGDVPGEHYVNRFEVLPIATSWRPARHRPRPRISGMQTATVVGPAGEEIYTDEHGRIKVQFHWDRGGASDENSSCFIRVVQPWSGNGWGFVFLPRIGMEVAVTFIDGDPDRPVVTGCLYNGSHSTPYPLPDEKTKSTIKSNSTPGGGGFNELRFEDAAGAEEIFLHAQKDFNEKVLNDHDTEVDHDQTNTVHNNQTEIVDVDQQMTVGGNRTVHVKGNFEETVDGTETRTVTGDVTETFSANETRDISSNQTETIGGSVSHTISGSQTDSITGSLSQTITGGVSVTTPATYEVTAVGGITMTAAAGMKMIAPGGFTVLAPGGTKTVDQDFWKFGGGQGDAFSWQIGIAAIKLDLVGMAMAHTNIKMEHTGMALTFTTAEASNIPAEIKTVGQALQQGYVGLHTFGLLSIL